MESEIPEGIQKELDLLEKLKKNTLELIPAHLICIEVQSAFKEINEIRSSLGVGFHCLQGALLHVDVKDIKEITPILRHLANLGWHLHGTPSDYAEIQRRTWLLKSKKEKGQIQVSAFFIGGACKFIKTGEEMKPIFELKCEPLSVSQ